MALKKDIANALQNNSSNILKKNKIDINLKNEVRQKILPTDIVERTFNEFKKSANDIVSILTGKKQSMSKEEYKIWIENLDIHYMDLNKMAYYVDDSYILIEASRILKNKDSLPSYLL